MEDDEGLLTDAEDSPPRHAHNTRDDVLLVQGTEVAGYLIDEEIGRGGMGNVYSATHRMIGKRAAIKVLKPDVSRSPIVVERFIQEARAVNQIHHPNIIDIFAFGALEDGRAYHIMDLLIGESLRKRLKRGALIPSEAASVIEETALALTAAHEKGFVHRDLKPDNIFLQTREDRWPEVKLLDFGLAKLMPEAGFAPFKTKTGVMLGTPEYMSPEQARGIGVDYRTDIYALGVCMFEIMAGRRPFISQNDAFATLMMHAEEPPPSLHEYVRDLPVEMVQLVDTMLAKDPASRPSLAAVRTVIKRLRSTQLPGRTLALELSASRKPQPEVAPDSLGDVRASRLGADSILPGDSKPLPALPSTVAGDRRISHPPHSGSARPPSQPPATHRAPQRASSPVLDDRMRQGGLAGTSTPNAPTQLSEPAIQLPYSAPVSVNAGAFPAAGASIPPVNQSNPGIPYSSASPASPASPAHQSLPPTPSLGSMPPTSLASFERAGSNPAIGSLYPPAQSTHGAKGSSFPPGALSITPHGGT
ncbi:MAG: protein kinase, partial [Deltaproteobacteria bacterium]|nr:protein kinase [Deltaproteobacteria bacterium]